MRKYLRGSRSDDCWVGGLDLGQAADYTALCLMQRTYRDDRGRRIWAIRYLRRWELQTPYTQIVADVVALLRRSEMMGGIRLGIDATGVGRPVVDMLLERRHLWPWVNMCAITITAGEMARRTAHGWNVPKKDLIGALVAGLQRGTIRLARGVQHAEILIREMRAFRASTRGARESYAARDGEHDDLVLAASIAAWLAVGKRTGRVRYSGPIREDRWPHRIV